MQTTLGDLHNHIRELTAKRSSHPKTGFIINLINSIPINEESIDRQVLLKAHQKMPSEYTTIENILNQIKDGLKKSGLIVVVSQSITPSGTIKLKLPSNPSPTEAKIATPKVITRIPRPDNYQYPQQPINSEQTLKEFKSWIRGLADSASIEFGHRKLTDTDVNKICEEFSVEVRTLLISGHRDNIIRTEPRGFKFTVIGKDNPNQYRYYWFRHRKLTSTGEYFDCQPIFQREWFIHAAEFVRLYHLAQAQGLRAEFEFDNLDIAIWQKSKMLAYYEAKKYLLELNALIPGLLNSFNKKFVRTKDINGKIGHIQKHHPEYFVGFTDTVHGIIRDKYKILYSGDSFILTKDKTPFDA